MRLHTEYTSNDYAVKWSGLSPPLPAATFLHIATGCTVERLYEVEWTGCVMHCGEATLTRTAVWCKMEKGH